MTIAVDFDGTVVEHKYPKIGEPMLFAFETLKQLQKEGHKLILWTYRSGDLLDEAVNYCAEQGVKFYAVNSSYPDEQFDEQKASRKIATDLFIDDRNLGGFPGWSAVWQQIGENPYMLDPEKRIQNDNAVRRFFRRLGF